jgi:hypothetical protein
VISKGHDAWKMDAAEMHVLVDDWEMHDFLIQSFQNRPLLALEGENCALHCHNASLLDENLVWTHQTQALLVVYLALMQQNWT